MRIAIATRTVCPRVGLGNSATFMPLASAERWVFASMLAGDESNGATAAADALGLKSFSCAATSSASSAGARTGFSVGT